MATVPRTTARGERSPTFETLVVLAGVFLVQVPLSLLGFPLALSPAVFATPWTLVTATYSHVGLGHLLGNATLLVFVGFLVERVTTRVRYHAFFVTSGAIAGLGQVLVGSSVVGASGAIFALLGYAITGNVVADRVLSAVDRLSDSRWATTGLLLAVALVLAVALSRPNSAIVAHVLGLLVGLASGQVRLLHVS